MTVAHTVLRYAPELSLDIDYLRRYIERDIGFLRGLAVVRAIGGGFADGGYTLRLLRAVIMPPISQSATQCAL